MRYRRALSRTAMSAAVAGLPVVPGAWWSSAQRRFECDLPGCARTGPHPAVRNESAIGVPGLGEGLRAQAIRRPEAVADRWRQQPYAVLIPTGDSVDVVDVPASLGRNLAFWLDARAMLGPVIAAGTRWFFLTTPGGQLSATGDVLVHGLGSWIMLPPSQGPGGEPAGWLAKPGRGGWAMPSRDDVVRGLLGPAGRARAVRAAAVPRISTGPVGPVGPVAAVVPAPRRQGGARQGEAGQVRANPA